MDEKKTNKYSNNAMIRIIKNDLNTSSGNTFACAFMYKPLTLFHS